MTDLKSSSRSYIAETTYTTASAAVISNIVHFRHANKLYDISIDLEWSWDTLVATVCSHIQTSCAISHFDVIDNEDDRILENIKDMIKFRKGHKKMTEEGWYFKIELDEIKSNIKKNFNQKCNVVSRYRSQTTASIVHGMLEQKIWKLVYVEYQPKW